MVWGQWWCQGSGSDRAVVMRVLFSLPAHSLLHSMLLPVSSLPGSLAATLHSHFVPIHYCCCSQGCASCPYQLIIPFCDARTLNKRTIVTPTIASPDFVKRLGLSHHFCEMLKGKGGRKTCQGYSGECLSPLHVTTSALKTVVCWLMLLAIVLAAVLGVLPFACWYVLSVLCRCQD